MLFMIILQKILRHDGAKIIQKKKNFRLEDICNGLRKKLITFAKIDKKLFIHLMLNS